MSNQFKRERAGHAGHIPHMPFAPGLAPLLWTPLLGADAGALGEFGTIAREWQDFVGRRLKENAALVQRLAHCSRPDQVLSAYTDFWRKAGEDYGKEIATLTDLATDMAGKMAAAAQSATDEASAKLFQREAA